MKQFVYGAVFGIAVGLVAAALTMPKLMLKEAASPLGYEETIEHIQKKVTDGGWKVSALMRLDKSLAKEGKDVLPVASFKICQPDHAEQILRDDDARFLSVMMPCSIGVYEKADGKTYISTMNSGLMGRLFGGTAQQVMGGAVADETAEFVKF
ncbi:hypothetical protein PDESU_03054 [Pontiella desulfatans]|uniref:DUF302 domain-containing protein n=1 Tax=Pontiella desulfatans TaxID=2750659 RepID=A0A6C2U3A6_PONDE|nr:DUF302 domain-containing protein [Pontiella desulfatans]VGO14492.1 hypothetical protein PDESU_03054 [Pontiella desulfatans]